MGTIYWWSFHILVIFVCTVFLVLGINMLRGAYGMQYPLNFFIAFFGSSMMIMICGSIIVGFSLRMIRRCRREFDGRTKEG